MRTHIINIKDTTKSSFRFDPSFHLSDAVVALDEIAKYPYGVVLLKNVIEKAFLGNIFSRVFVKNSEHGIPYLAASDTVLESRYSIKYLSRKQASKLRYLILDKDWIVITCSGTIGNVTYTDNSYTHHIATHDLIRIIPNDKKMLKGFLYAFLSSKYGYSQLTKSKFGGVVKHINVEHVNNICIPCFPEAKQVEIDNLIKCSIRERESATRFLDEAKKLLMRYINTTFDSTSGYVFKKKNIKDIIASNYLRLDPPVYVNNSIDSFKQIQTRCVKLQDCNVHIWYPGMFKRTYVTHGLPYLQGSSVFEKNPFKRCSHLSLTKTPKLEELWLKQDMILITCAGSCGQIKLITKEYEDKGAIGSPDIIRLVSEDDLFTSEYLFVYLQCPMVQDYMNSFKYGSVIERFDAHLVSSIPVIIPTKEVSDEITALIKKYKNSIYNAFVAEENAVLEIEQEIMTGIN